MSTSINDFGLPPGLELDRIITLQEAMKISSLSRDSWKRHHWDKVVELSPRRLGVRLRDALMINRPAPDASTRTATRASAMNRRTK